MQLTIYHGSQKIVEHPIYGQGKTNNDYGRGFYCTENAELAKEWACGTDRDGYANRYKIEIDGLKILDLSSGEYHILHWLALLLNNRNPAVSTPVAKAGMEYLKKRWLLDITDYDMIKGYRADDSYFSFARAFLTNQITLEQLSLAMELGKLGEQIVLKSEEAFGRLDFDAYEIADSAIYFPKRTNRDQQARNDYFDMLQKGGIAGTFMSEILAKGDDFDVRI